MSAEEEEIDKMIVFLILIASLVAYNTFVVKTDWRVLVSPNDWGAFTDWAWDATLKEMLENLESFSQPREDYVLINGCYVYVGSSPGEYGSLVSSVGSTYYSRNTVSGPPTIKTRNLLRKTLMLHTAKRKVTKGA